MAKFTPPGMVHTVYFWLNTEEAAERRQFEQGLRSLAGAPSVRQLFIGKPAATPSRGVVDNSFDYNLVLWFDDVAGHDAYQESEIHLTFVADHEAKFKVVRVYDNELITQ